MPQVNKESIHEEGFANNSKANINKKKAKIIIRNKENGNEVDEDGDELQIPAFIRRKMG